ncbi:DUF4190 domain-containing protein [Streptomyces sp. NPDC058646]|uniref:DUF4190 domain-containing protein n=1 Tax=Streptomyces sp. NPDC058646 TaxID=3346574 RepID=UPI003649A305
MPARKTNVLAVVAFVMSILCPLPLVPLVLGVIALSQIRNRGEQGKGLAVAAIAINGATLVLYAFALVFGFSGALDDAPKRSSAGQVTEPGSIEVQDIRRGDCFTTDDDLTEHRDEGENQASYSVRVVPCDQPHEGEAYAVFDLEDGAYPGPEKIASIAEERCSGAALTDYVGADANLEKLDSYYYHPRSDSWDLGDREVTCFLGDSTGTTTGSVRAP